MHLFPPGFGKSRRPPTRSPTQKKWPGRLPLPAGNRRQHSRDWALELCVFGLVDYTHAAFTELAGDLVMADGLPDQDEDIVPPSGLLLITIDVTNYDIFLSPGA